MGDLIVVRRWLVALGLFAVAPTAVAASPLHPEIDTVLAVERGVVLIGEGYSGRVTVTTWDRDQVELVEEAGEGRVALRRAGNRLTLGGSGARRRGGGTIRLRVPAWLPVQLRGASLSASVDGLSAVMDLSTVEGDLDLRNVAGDVFASSVEGVITVQDAEGRIRLRSVNQGVRVSRVSAESLVIQSTSGDILLDGVDAGTVDARTTDGDVSFDGSLRPSGQYRLATHDGDLIVTLPAAAEAVVTVSTFDGTFTPEFPITVDRFQGGKQMTFTLGGGGSRLSLTTFDGDILLRRRQGEDGE